MRAANSTVGATIETPLTFPLALAALLALVPGATYLLATLGALAYHRKRPSPDDAALARAWPDGLPRVSILKPCKGADPGFDENLRSFLRLDGAPHEVLIAFTTEDDPGVAIARRVLAEERHPAARLMLVPARPGLNPKVTNLIAMAAEATGTIHLVADSNVRADPGVLRRVLLPLSRPEVAAAACVFEGVAGTTLAARLQATMFGTLVLVSLTGAHVLFGVGNIIGKCFAYKAADLASLGGWEHYLDRLVEDAPLSRDLQHKGRRVVVVPGPVKVHLGELTWEAFRLHEERWWVLNRSYQYGATVLGAMWWSPVYLGLLASAFGLFGERTGAALLLAAAGSNLAMQVVNQARYGGSLRTTWAVPLEAVYLAWKQLQSWFRDTVVWRGVRYRLGPESRILPITDDERR